MAVSSWLIVDLATAPLPNAAEYLDGVVRAPSTYKDPEKIAAYIAEKEVERLQMAGTDLDLARITAIGTRGQDYAQVGTCHTEDDERLKLTDLAKEMGRKTLITFGGINFDLPLLMRRARYLGVAFPTINLDRYRSPHVDLCELLSDRNPQRRRSLDFYTLRLGWRDLMPKPLSGADEARVAETGRWDELVKSVSRDVEATYRLAVWLGVIEPMAHERGEEPII